jgi:hypothetical protein
MIEAAHDGWVRAGSRPPEAAPWVGFLIDFARVFG